MTELPHTAPKSISEALGGLKLDLETTTDNATCRKCGQPVGTVLKVFSESIHCDPCVEAYQKDRDIESIKGFWEKFCPRLYAETDTKHEDFVQVWPMVSRYSDPKQNLIFCGASGKCKTRAMMHRLKLCLLKGHSIDVLWADELDEAIESRKLSNLRKRLSEPSVLGIDDFLTSGSAFEKTTSFLKGLIDTRLREGKGTILTTNLSARDIESDSDKFGNSTKADQQRVQAIIRRLRGEFQTIDFDAGVGSARF